MDNCNPTLINQYTLLGIFKEYYLLDKNPIIQGIDTSKVIEEVEKI